MSFLGSVKALFGGPIEKKSIELSEPAIAEIFGALPTISGVSVSPNSARTVPAVRNALTIISETVGALPCKLYRREDDGDGKEVARDHPAFPLIHDYANDDQGVEEFRAQVTVDALLNDVGYALVRRYFDGRPMALHRIDPTRVQRKQAPDGSTFYEVQTDGGKRVVANDDMLRLPCPGGRSPIKDAREAIALALVLEQTASRLFSRGGRPSGVLSFPAKLGDESAKRMRDGWHAAHSGENTGRTAILEEGGKFEQFTFSSADSEFLAFRQFQVVDIARAFGVPPTLLMSLENGTYANVEQLSLAFRTFTLNPLLLSWQRAYGRSLLAVGERPTFFVKFDTHELNAADTVARTDELAKLIQSRVLTPNEARSSIGLPSHPQGNDLVNPNTTTNGTGSAPVPAKEAA